MNVMSIGQIGPLVQVDGNVYTSQAVAPTGETFYMAIEPLVEGEKWERYIFRAGFLTFGGNSALGTIGSLTEIGDRVDDEKALDDFLSCRSNPDFWRADKSAFDQLKSNLRRRKVTTGSSTAEALSVILHASRGVNITQQTHMVYASKTPITSLANFSKTSDKTGFGSIHEMYGNLIMSVGCRISNIVENRGIFRNPLNIVEGGYGGVAMMLHSFTCMYVQQNHPQINTFFVRPLKKMGEIFLESLPKDKVLVDDVPGDVFDQGFENERNVQVPIEILAKLARAGV